jgi:phosphinothricin acetyltransferase
MDYHLEPMAAAHQKAVIDIFNHYIRHSHAAFPAEPVDYAFFQRFLEMSQGYPAVVVRDAHRQVVGFAFLRPYHPAATFKRTAEFTCFILPEHTRHGLGAAILELFIEQAAPRGIDVILAAVSSRNVASLKFHRQQGFTECGRFVEVGRKFGEDVDVIWLQKHLGRRP